MKKNIGTKLLSGISALLTIFAVGLLLITVISSPANAKATETSTIINQDVSTNIPAGTCGMDGSACDGSCGGSCGGTCGAATTGSCGCGA